MSTLALSPRRTGAGLLAFLTSFLVVLSGLFVAPTVANAVPASPALHTTEAPRAGGTITVTGEGFAAEEPGVYVGIAPAGLSGFYAASAQLLDTVWVAPGNEDGSSDQGRTAKLQADGTFSFTFTVPAYSEGASYALYSSKAHGQGFSDPSQNATQVIAYEPAVVPPATATTTAVDVSSASVTVGDSVVLTATVTPSAAAGTVAFFDNDAPIADAQAQPVADGAASYSTTAFAAGSHAITAKFTPSDAAAFAESTSASTTVEVVEGSTPNPPADPRITASVTAASTAGLTVSATVENIVLRAAADVPDTHKDDAGVYVGIIEKDKVDDYRTNASAGAKEDFAYKMFIADGRVTRTISVPAEKLDWSKQYVAVTWLAHGFLNDDRYLAQTDLDVTREQWNEVFGSGPRIAAEVIASSTAGLKVSATVENIVLRAAADVPDTHKDDAGVYIGIIEKDRVSEYGSNASAGAKEDFAYKMFIADGKVTRTIDVPAGKLDRTKQYVAVTWLAHGFLTESRSLAQTDLEVSDAQWERVFGSGASVTSTAGGVLGVRAKATALDPAALPNGVYVGLVKRGTADTAQMANLYGVQWVSTIPGNGEVVQDLKPIENSKLDRTAEYDVLIWKGHTNPGPANNLLVLPVTISAAQWNELFGTTPVAPTPEQPAPVGTQQAGSLIWSISSAFQTYVTGEIARGSISTNGVGSASGAYLYPQASDGSWNAASQTGTVAYSGVVTFTGHGGLLSETFANPVITVSSATSGTISVHGASYPLNLAAATKTVGANGEVTWSNVPVNGVISGGGSSGGSSGGGSLAYDNLTFTVGATSAIQYGSTTRGVTKAEREAAPTAPTTVGLKIVTPKDEFVPGGEIEIEADGFEANERDILVVLYSDPVVLDRNAGADADGKVRWIGTLPKDLPAGKHTITLQGSKNAGAELTVVTAAVKKSDSTAGSGAPLAASADTTEAGNDQAWVWWIGAGALVVLAAALAGLVVSQRRRAAEVAAGGSSGAGLAG